MAPVDTRTLFTCGQVEYIRETPTTRVKFWKRLKRWIPNPFNQPFTTHADHLCFRCSEDHAKHERNHPFMANPRIKRRAPPTRGTSQTLIAIALAEDETSIQALKTAQEHNLHHAGMRLPEQVCQMTVAQQIASKEAEHDLERSYQFWNSLHESHKHLVDFSSNKSYGAFAELHLCHLCLDRRRALVDPMYREKTQLRDHFIVPDSFSAIPQDDSDSDVIKWCQTASLQVVSEEEMPCRPVGDDFIAEIGATMVPQAGVYHMTPEEQDAAVEQEFSKVAARMAAAVRRGRVQQVQEYPEEIFLGYAVLTTSSSGSSPSSSPNPTPASSPGSIPTTFDESSGMRRDRIFHPSQRRRIWSSVLRRLSRDGSNSDADTDESPARVVPVNPTVGEGRAVPVAPTHRDMEIRTADAFAAHARTTHRRDDSLVNEANASPPIPANQQTWTRHPQYRSRHPNPNHVDRNLERVRNFLSLPSTATAADIINIPLLHPSDPRFSNDLYSASVPPPTSHRHSSAPARSPSPSRSPCSLPTPRSARIPARPPGSPGIPALDEQRSLARQNQNPTPASSVRPSVRQTRVRASGNPPAMRTGTTRMWTRRRALDCASSAPPSRWWSADRTPTEQARPGAIGSGDRRCCGTRRSSRMSKERIRIRI